MKEAMYAKELLDESSVILGTILSVFALSNEEEVKKEKNGEDN
jgi:hypothetical protein